MSQSISREDLKNLIDSGGKPTIIEALPKQYYEDEHLPGAVNIPHDEVQASASLVIPHKNEVVVVYCASMECRNSHAAAQTLRQLGYTHVYEYVEGKKGWKDAGFLLEKSVKPK